MSANMTFGVLVECEYAYKLRMKHCKLTSKQ